MNVNKVDYNSRLSSLAYYCKSSLDKNPSCFIGVQEKNATAYYKDFLIEKLKNPISATLAMRDVVAEHPIECIEDFSQNQRKLDAKPEIRDLINKINAKEDLYPKTCYARQEIIAQDRISLNYVKQKLTGLKKLAFKLKLMF